MVGIVIFLLVAAIVTGGIVFAIFIFAKTNDDPLKRQSGQDNLIDTESDSSRRQKTNFDWGKVFLSLGPILVGLGIIGLIWQYWDNYNIQVKLGIGISSLLAIDIFGLFLLELGQRRKSTDLLLVAKSLMIIGSFLLGGVLFLIGDALSLNPLNVGALLGLWFLGTLPFTFIVRNLWQFGVSAFVGAIYIISFITLGARIELNEMEVSEFVILSGNTWFYYSVLFIFLGTNAFIYSFSKNQLQRGLSTLPKFFTYGFQIINYLGLLAAVLLAVVNENELIVDNFVDSIYLYSILAFALLFLAGTIGLEYFGKAYQFSTWWLPGSIILFSGLTGFLGIPGFSELTGIFLIQLPLVLWVVWEYLQKPNILTAILAYVFNTIFYLIWATREDLFASISLLLGVVIFLILATYHSSKRDFLIYSWIAAAFAAIVKILVLGLEASWVIFIAGIFLMLVGLYLIRIQKSRGKN